MTYLQEIESGDDGLTVSHLTYLQIEKPVLSMAQILRFFLFVIKRFKRFDRNTSMCARPLSAALASRPFLISVYDRRWGGA